MLYLFLRQEFQFQCNGLLDTSDMFYFSFDPIGTSRLTEFDLQRFGFVTAHSFYHSVESKDVPDDIMDAILELGDYPSLHEDQTLEEFICSSLPITRRSSSVDRITRTPNPYRIHNSLHHPRSHYTKHEPLCELAGGKECVCPEAKRQRISAGFFGGFTNDIEYNGRECPCFSREPKRQRTKSVDRADRMMIRILRWMTLARDIGMADSGELLKWYLFPTVFDSYAIDYRQISFGLRQVSPWTVLVDPPEPERVGRPTQRRPP
ncbi:hypothetical protein DL96DRAFT_1199017 [Flagelloscypha sp. PMI_526]|nr:hypothetical protein DL96DRAFT_1199017 [Flagelloscypha sp. PMI_526]